MLTVGGLLHEKGQATSVAKCGFSQLPFVRENLRPKEKPFLIEVPRLTYREIRRLDRQLPRRKNRKLTLPKVPLTAIKDYERIYRYFPTFAETEL
jgi:hypothetical protein